MNVPGPRRAKEVNSEFKNLKFKIAADLLGFHLCEGCSKENEDCLERFAEENARVSIEKF